MSLNLPIFKATVAGIRDFDLHDGDKKLVITMKDEKKPIFEYRKDDGAIALHLENCKSTGLNLGLLMTGIANGLTQGNTAMKQVNVFDSRDQNVIATLDNRGRVKAVPDDNGNSVKPDDLEMKMINWIMDNFENDADPVDPIVGVVGLARLVQTNNENVQRESSRQSTRSHRNGERTDLNSRGADRRYEDMDDED